MILINQCSTLFQFSPGWCTHCLGGGHALKAQVREQKVVKSMDYMKDYNMMGGSLALKDKSDTNLRLFLGGHTVNTPAQTL